jgi:CRP/FNR family transcriptional regulator
MASASVLEDAAICFIPKDAFLSLLRESPAFSMHMMGFLARDLKKAEQGELSLAQETVKERLAETLMILKEFFGVEEDGSTIKTNMTREEIASIVGTATETVIRLLSEFRRRKLIALDGKHIKILNPDSLRRMTRIFD